MSALDSFRASDIGLLDLVPPILAEQVLRATVGMVNVAFLSRLSDQAVSAAGVSNQYIMMCQIIASAVATGTIVCINQSLGMNNLKKTEKLATIAFFANAALGLCFSLLFLFLSGPFLTIMRLEADTLREAESYLRIVGGTMVLQCCEIVLSNVCRSVGRTRAPLLVNLVQNGMNLLGCYLVVFQPFALPLRGVTGVAAVNVMSKAAGLAVSALILHRAGIRIRARYLRPFPWEDCKLAISIGIPAGVNNIAYSASQLATTSLISLTGPLMVSAKIYISNIVGYVALVGIQF